jgi:hypothetical protein
MTRWEVPEDVLRAAETITLWARETHHESFRLGDVVYATDYRELRHLYMPHEIDQGKTMTERETQHLLRCAILLVQKPELTHTTAGESRVEIAHKLQVFLAQPFPSELRFGPLHVDEVRAIALNHGFKKKPQPDGEDDLNPYVYDFAHALWEELQCRKAAAPTPPAQDSVKIPTSEAEAELMAKLGMMWLEQNAPDRLKTPPAQEDEPFAWHYKSPKGQCVSLCRDTSEYRDSDEVETPLYTRPQSDELRKAAESILTAIDQTDPQLQWSVHNAIDALRAALKENP